MDVQDIKNTIREAAETSRRLRITGYRTSNGDVMDYDVSMLGPGGYKDLVQASLDLLPTTVFPDGEPEEVASEEAQARKELEESFQTSLDGGHGRSGPSYVDSGEGWHHKEGDADAVVLCNLRADRTSRTEPGRASTRRSAPLTIAKGLLRQQLPVSKYLGQLVLTPDKVDMVKVLR